MLEIKIDPKTQADADSQYHAEIGEIFEFLHLGKNCLHGNARAPVTGLVDRLDVLHITFKILNPSSSAASLYTRPC